MHGLPNTIKKMVALGENQRVKMKLSTLLKESSSDTLRRMEQLVRDGMGLKSLKKIEHMDKGNILIYVFSNPKEGKLLAKSLKKKNKLKKTQKVGDNFAVFMDNK